MQISTRKIKDVVPRPVHKQWLHRIRDQVNHSQERLIIQNFLNFQQGRGATFLRQDQNTLIIIKSQAGIFETALLQTLACLVLF